MKARHLGVALAIAAGAVTAVLGVIPAKAATKAPAAQHVVLAGISGLRWSDISARQTPALYAVADKGSVGNLVDYAVLPLTCPADGWLTLNAGARAQVKHSEHGPCPALPQVEPVSAGAAQPQAGIAARIPAMPGIAGYNSTLKYGASFGTLDGTNTGCATAVGPGAALALADSRGSVSGYLPGPADVTAQTLQACRLTVIDLGALPPATPATPATQAARQRAVKAADAELARITSDLPANTELVVVTAGSLAKAQLGVAIISGPGFASGVLNATSTRQPGMVVLTDLTPTVLSLLGQPVKGLDGTTITRGDRGSLGSAITSFTGRETAEEVWTSTHSAFFWTYSLADAAVLGGIGLIFWGADPGRRRRRASGWRVAGVYAAAVPVATFLPNLVPWWQYPHPALWLYGLAGVLTAAVGTAALRCPWRRETIGPFGLISLVTLAVLGLDVMTGSRLQMETPFGLSVLEAGRFYGIGNEALGIYGIAALTGAAWLGMRARSERSMLSVTCAVGGFAVIASGWPGFGAKVGGTIAMVPCFLLLIRALAGGRITWRWLALAAVSGIALFVAFALVNYLLPWTGVSDVGSFTGNTLHGHSGGLISRKVSSMLGSLSLNAYGVLVPLTLAVAGLMLWRPAWFRLRTIPLAYAAERLLPVLLGVLWLMPVLGWLADDSGVIVPATALPFGLPLGIALAAAAAYRADKARYLGTASAPVAGQTV